MHGSSFASSTDPQWLVRLASGHGSRRSQCHGRSEDFVPQGFYPVRPKTFNQKTTLSETLLSSFFSFFFFLIRHTTELFERCCWEHVWDVEPTYGYGSRVDTKIDSVPLIDVFHDNTRSTSNTSVRKSLNDATSLHSG